MHYAAKALVQAVLAVLSLLELWIGWSPGGWLTEEWLLALLAVIGPFAVYYTRNRPP